MKIIDTFYHEFKGFNLHDSKIKVHLYDGIVILQDLSNGTSITNSCEQLASEICKLKELDPETVRWFEIYPYYDSQLTEIKFHYNQMSEEFSLPKWSIVTEKELLLLTQTIKHEESDERGT